eukprot:TRINITY_DN6922_c0_g1_i1.p1 TRINITY_DN6922_c0_g1~~TRINITY_DN6922_c0_g1_i1.p1  ORF type:complete len:265 (+),score=52.54 TRINITY_DN6922_c0_g1_i1:50-844(+)
MMAGGIPLSLGLCLISTLALGSPLSSSQKTDPFYIQRLTNEILRDYNPSSRPSDASRRIGNVTFGLSPTCLNIRSHGLIFGNLWYKMNWYDERLRWKASWGVESLSIPNELIWKPDIVPFFGQDGPHFDSKYQVKVFRDGKVLFVPSMEFKHRCFRGVRRNLSRKVIRCNLEFGSWTYDSDMMNVNFFGGKPAVDTSTYDYDFCGTKLLQSSATRKIKKIEGYPKSYVSLVFHLKLMRKGRRIKIPRRKKFYIRPLIGKEENAV